jgi:Retrotransposon gag protein
MATPAPREIKLCSPTPFSGDPDKTTKFLQEIELYLTMNVAIYDTDEKKIVFSFSFMKGGTAAGWNQTFVNDALNATPQTFGTWAAFKNKVLAAFSPVDAEGKAHTDIKHLKQGSGPVDDYIAQFQIIASKCRITDDKSLIEYFIDGLNVKLLEKVFMMEKMPTTITAWYKAAARFDGQYRRVKAIVSKLKHDPDAVKAAPAPRVTYVVRDPNAMDVDAVRLTQEERLDHLRKGKCFVCHQTGHRSSNHKGGRTPPCNNQGRFVPQKRNTTDTYKKIRALVAELPKEEKEEVFKKMEDLGF